MAANSRETRARDRAEAQFRKTATVMKEGEKAKAQYDAAGQAVRDKTERLRALRLAKEACEPAPAAKPSKRAARKPA